MPDLRASPSVSPLCGMADLPTRGSVLFPESRGPISPRAECVCPLVWMPGSSSRNNAGCWLLVQNGACSVRGRGSGGVRGDLGHVEKGRRPWAGGSAGPRSGGGPCRCDRASGGAAASGACLLFIAESKILQK